SILDGRPDGTFAPAVNYVSQPFTPSTYGPGLVITTGDSDGDGRVELLVGASNSESWAFFSQPHGVHFRMAAPATVLPGVPFAVTLTALDASDQPMPGYSGTVHFFSNDWSAGLPADVPITNGAGTALVTLRQPGSRTLVATDATNHIAGRDKLSVFGQGFQFRVDWGGSVVDCGRYNVRVRMAGVYVASQSDYVGPI